MNEFAKLIQRSIWRCCFVVVMGLMAGCATPIADAPKFQWGQVVNFEGFVFKFNSVESKRSYFIGSGRSVSASDSFVVVDLSTTNRTGGPVPFHLQPIFRLIDSNGSVYESSLKHTIQHNHGRSEYTAGTESMNPNTTQRRALVFEAPKGTYQVQVIVPSQARMAFAGSVKAAGPYFLYDIASQL